MITTTIRSTRCAGAAKAMGCALLVATLMSGCHQQPIVGPALVLEPTASLLHQVGRFDASQKAMVAVPGEKGFVAFGPYAELPPGLYRVAFEISIAGANGVAGSVDVNAFTADQPVQVLATSELKNGDGQKISLEFTAKPGTKYEFRVMSDGTATMKLLGIVVTQHQ